MNRFLRPEPTNIVSNDQNSLQESVADGEPAKCGHAEGDASVREVDEEHPLATAPLLSSSPPVVTWDLCTTEIDLGSDEESVQHKTQLSRDSESKASEEGEGTREEQFAQTGSDDAGLLVAKDAKEDEQEENGDQKSCARGRNESDEYEEHEDTRSGRLTGDAMSEDMEESGRKAGAEEETERATTPDLEEMDETATKIRVMEEDDKTHREDEQDLEAEDTEVKLCTIKDLSLEEEDTKRIEEARVQRDEADTAVMHEEVENHDGVLLLASENEKNSDEEARQVENQLCEELSGDNRDLKGDPDFTSLHELQMAHDNSGIVSEDELTVAGREHVTAHRRESDKVEAESTLDEREQGAAIEEEDVNEAANNRTIDGVPEQEDDIQAVAEDSQEEDILTGHVTCSEEIAQNAKTELHAVEFTDGEQEDVVEDTKVQTKRREADDVETESHGTMNDEKCDMTTTDISADEVEEERLCSEVVDKESYMEVACTITSVTVKSQGETGQEISGEFKNVLLGVCEGQIVVSQELNSPTCEETQEGVPEHNNEPGEPDENTTQRFLEVGDCEEIPTTQLPEEVESDDPESLQNSGCNTGADYSLVSEHMEEEQDRTEDIKNSFDLVVEEHAELLSLTELSQETEKPLEPVIEESGLLFEEEEGKLLLDSMKTGVEQTEFETHVGLTDETDKATKELQDGTEELLVEFEIDEGLCDSKEADAAGDGCETTGAEAAEVRTMTETSFLQELADAIKSEHNGDRTRSLLEDITESGFMKQSVETEPKLLEVNAVEMQDAGIDMEETGYGFDEEEAEDEMQNKNEMELLNLQVEGMAAELTTERNEKENTLIAELSESLETKTQLSEEALETSNREMLTDTEAADGSMTTGYKPEGLTVISAEEMTRHETGSEASYAEETAGRQDVIDEEILDLWIQTALSEDTDGIKQQEGPEQLMDTEIEPSNEEQDDISSVQTEKDKEQIVEANSGESELVSDTEMSSSTVESGFLDQSLSEWGTQNSEAQLLKSTSTGSFQGIHDTLANMSESADISEASTQQANSGSQDILTEETAETGESYPKEEESITETGFLPLSDVTSLEARHLNQESDGSQEKTDEETGSQVTDLARESDWKDAEEADVESLAETSALFKAEETEVEDEPLEITPDSERSRSGSEASLEEGNVSTESGSPDDTCTESERKLSSLDKPQPGWSEDVGESLPDLHGAEVAEQLTTISEDEMEVSFLNIFNYKNV